MHDPIQSRGRNNVNKKEVIKGGFFETQIEQQRLVQSDDHQNHHLEVTFFLPFLFFMHVCIHSYIKDNA